MPPKDGGDAGRLSLTFQEKDPTMTIADMRRELANLGRDFDDCEACLLMGMEDGAIREVEIKGILITAAPTMEATKVVLISEAQAAELVEDFWKDEGRSQGS